MSTHITPPPRVGQTGLEAAEPARRASRFDERGIALQTIIIMVVLLAIAGAVAAVLFNRAGQETQRLEDSAGSVEIYGISSELLCRTGNGTWQTRTAAVPAGDDHDALDIARPDVDWGAAGTDGWCKPNN